MVLLCCFLIPFYRFCFVSCHPSTMVIAVTQLTLRICIPLLRRFAVPFRRSSKVFRYTISVLITKPQIVLRQFITILCRFTIPLDCFSKVFFYTFTPFIAAPQAVLRLCIALFCSFLIPLHRLFFVLCHTISIFIEYCKVTLSCCISLLRRFAIPLSRLSKVFFNAFSTIIAIAKITLCHCIALFCRFAVPHDRIFFVFFHTSAVLIAPGHFKLCLRASVISGRDHVLLERHFRIACLLIILGIMQVVLLGFLFRLLLRFLAQTEAFHASHKLLLFIFRANKQETVHSIFLIAEIYLLDFSPQTAPLHAAHSRFKPLLDRFCLDGLRDFHSLSTHTDGLQLIRKTHFYLNFTHILSLLMVL